MKIRSPTQVFLGELRFSLMQLGVFPCHIDILDQNNVFAKLWNYECYEHMCKCLKDNRLNASCIVECKIVDGADLKTYLQKVQE